MKSKSVVPRVFIAIVLFLNVQSAVEFLVRPGAYMGGFGLAGAAGEQMTRAMGLLFLMWNVPYAFALANPLRNKISLIESAIMQAVGLAGEACILLLGGPYPERTSATIIRFIAFDGGGLVLLLAALVLVTRDKRGTKRAR